MSNNTHSQCELNNEWLYCSHMGKERNGYGKIRLSLWTSHILQVMKWQMSNDVIEKNSVSGMPNRINRFLFCRAIRHYQKVYNTIPRSWRRLSPQQLCAWHSFMDIWFCNSQQKLILSIDWMGMSRENQIPFHPKWFFIAKIQADGYFSRKFHLM